MRTLVVSSNERKNVKQALASRFELLEMKLPFDYLLYTKRGPVALERKRVPQDFIASVTDGRFHQECSAMREYSQWCFVILEGRWRWRKGQLAIGNRVLNWSDKAIRNLKLSLCLVEGCHIIEARNVSETARAINELAEYFDTTHDSLTCRPGISSDWPKPLERERYLYWLQGLPEVKAGRARAMAIAFPTPQGLFLASKEELEKVKGVGHYLSTRIWEFLHGGK